MYIYIYIYICMQFFLKPRHQGDDASPQGAKKCDRPALACCLVS